MIDNKEATVQAFQDPQVGDLFDEMCSYWIYIVARDGERVTTMESAAPCTFPKDGKVTEYATLEAFRKAFRYPTNSGYFVRLSSRSHDVSGWLDGKEIGHKPEPERYCGNCEHWVYDEDYEIHDDDWKACLARTTEKEHLFTVFGHYCDQWLKVKR
jgi:hypothetical protein